MATAAAAPPAEVFGALPEEDFVVLSPNGHCLALAHTTAGDTKVLVLDVASRAVKRTQFIARNLKLRGLNWSDDETLLIEVSVSAEISARQQINRWEFYRTLALDVNTGQTRTLLMANDIRSQVTAMRLVALHAPKPRTAIMSTLDWSAVAQGRRLGTRLTNERRDSGWVAALFEVDTRSGEGTLVEQGTPYTTDWVVDQQGRAAARGEWNPGTRVSASWSSADSAGTSCCIARALTRSHSRVSPPMARRLSHWGHWLRTRASCWQSRWMARRPTCCSRNPRAKSWPSCATPSRAPRLALTSAAPYRRCAGLIRRRRRAMTRCRRRFPSAG